MITKTVAATALIAVFVANAGCKKSVDPNAFDAGAAPVATVVAAPAAEVVDAAAPLAPLATTAAPVVKKVAPKDGGTDAAVAAAAAPAAPAAPVALSPAGVAACNNARTTCGSPKVGTDAKLKKLCDAFTADCKAAGGTI